MSQKIFDIIPPDKKDKNLNEKEFVLTLKETKAKKVKKRKTSFSVPGFKFLIILLILLIGGLLFGFFVFSETEIDIWPKSRYLQVNTEILLSTSVKKPDFNAKIIPAKVFSHLSEKSGTFSSSGKALKETKARGIIRVFNSYSTSPQPLLPHTRFISEDGKLFRSVRREVIKGGHYEKGKFVPGFTDIEVVAAEPGEEYNIGPSTFSIPGFKGTGKYSYFYGKSFSPMTGGFKGETPQITEKDIEKAKEELIKRAEREDKDFLRRSLSEDYILLDSLIFQKVLEMSEVKPGTFADKFNLKIKVKTVGLAFKKTDSDKFLNDVILSNALPNEKIQEKSKKINYSVKSSLDFGKEETEIENVLENKPVSLSVKGKVLLYQTIDIQNLKKALLGKTSKEVKIFLKDLPEVEKVNIKKWPFLRRKVPDNFDKIKINFHLPD